ncbi:MAG: hypothetical protein LKF79_02495 [Solobacterium sp.]|jgi:magnesium-transporting ATPase (P-type)|nr:hypothetical protein [Solobacterium sp.]MCH4221887.1 hypothetical protein [Solobacterium sp.]MCH4265497.1 hypothetical protein [Solobacterium sp.]
MKNSESPESRLKVFSILFLFLAAMDIFSLVVSYVAGNFDVTSIAAASGVSTSAAQTSIMIIVGISIVIILCKVFLGIQGIRQSSGKQIGSANSKLAWVAMVLFAICCILSFVEAFKGTAEWTAPLNLLVSVMILYAYIKDTKTLSQK